MVRYKIVIRSIVDAEGYVQSVEWAVIAVDQDGHEARVTNWTENKAVAESQLASYRNHAVARAG